MSVSARHYALEDILALEERAEKAEAERDRLKVELAEANGGIPWLREIIENLEVCRDHWKTSYEQAKTELSAEQKKNGYLNWITKQRREALQNILNSGLLEGHWAYVAQARTALAGGKEEDKP